MTASESSPLIPVGPLSATVEQLFREIRQIHGQYKREVPRKRGPWPQAVQARILELWKLGVTTNQISEATGLSTQTMYSWLQRLKKTQPGFLPLPIAKKRGRSPGQVLPIPLSPSSSHGESTTVIPRPSTLTVVLPNGVRLEGVPADQAGILARELASL